MKERLTEKEKFEKVVISMFGGSKNDGEFFKTLNNDEYVGYVTAIIHMETKNFYFFVPQKLEIIKRLFLEGKL